MPACLTMEHVGRVFFGTAKLQYLGRAQGHFESRELSTSLAFLTNPRLHTQTSLWATSANGCWRKRLAPDDRISSTTDLGPITVPRSLERPYAGTKWSLRAMLDLSTILHFHCPEVQVAQMRKVDPSIAVRGRVQCKDLPIVPCCETPSQRCAIMETYKLSLPMASLATARPP
jgi:hypothetical protein